MVVCIFLGDHAATNGNDNTIVLAEHTLQSAFFDGAKAGLAIERKNFGEGHASLFFNFAVEFDEGNVAIAAQQRAERGLAGTAQADEGNTAAAGGIFLAEVAHDAESDIFQTVWGNAFEKTLDQFLLGGFFEFGSEKLGERDVERGSDAAEEYDGDVAFAGFELREVTLGNVGFTSGRAPSHAAAVTQFAHALAQRSEKAVFAERGNALAKSRVMMSAGGHGRAQRCSIIQHRSGKVKRQLALYCRL